MTNLSQQFVAPNGLAALYFELWAENEAHAVALLQLFAPIFKRFAGPKVFLLENIEQKKLLQVKLANCECSDFEIFVRVDDNQPEADFFETADDISDLCRLTGQQVLAVTNGHKLTGMKNISKTVCYVNDEARLLKNLYFFYHSYMQLENVSFHCKTHLSVELLQAWKDYGQGLGIADEIIEKQHARVHQMIDAYLVSLMKNDAYGDLVRDLMTKAQGKLNQLHFELSKRRDKLKKRLQHKPSPRLEIDLALLNDKLTTLCQAINQIKPLRGKQDLNKLQLIIDGLYHNKYFHQHTSTPYRWLNLIKRVFLPSYAKSRLKNIRLEIDAMIRETRRELARTSLPNTAIKLETQS